ncbi:phosphate regulon transcriptional regulator PhoB [Spongiibacter sp. KMU-158]|uniref:Phosphate regulon transcriptional regulatory protein PhoB n=1 Tax=Spongiibacter pelagi TaxID=2760804 RepID=A0A927C1S5_9GAMM|nr:phosphate regulon transcriptional regulator PhoB [Spongiibacter pelagi]MBD2859149.1 phosphate regulon transcriptional regulator PhoB [Spongiibacter pelagi]
MSTEKILIVDDEVAISDMLAMALGAEGYEILTANNAQKAHAIILDQRPDLVLLDWMMPGTSGLELLLRLRKDELTKTLPVIMLTAKAEEESTITGLDAGADDYIRKPFSQRELLSRINALLRRHGREQSEELIQVGEMKFDPIGHRVLISEQDVNLGPTEFRLLEFFLTHQDRVYSRSQLLDHVWGTNTYVEERTVDVHIRRLRKAIAIDGHDDFIQTVRGSGYRFSERTS